ncbi:MAG: hypothetical protein R2729_31040 [Bryobacteraceae bacterium]
MIAAALALVTWADVNAALHPYFEQEHIAGSNFAGFVERVEQSAAQRLREGMADHLVFYVLQSRAFTAAEPIVPARSAREFHYSGAIPAAVRARMDAFLAAPKQNERARLLTAVLPQIDGEDAYRRAMRFLYEKEFASRSRHGDDRREFVAGLYATRGLATDTAPDASTAAVAELASLAAREPDTRFRRVLIVGPGLDLAPREHLREDAPPRSRQPVAIAGALRQHGLAAPDLIIDCADINPIVVDAINAEHKPGIAASVRNIVTAHPEPAVYDLIVATNILLYLPRLELLLALNNIHGALAPGGYFLHNETRAEIEEFTAPLGFAPINARMVRLGARGSTGLYDAAVLHRKPPPARQQQ